MSTPSLTPNLERRYRYTSSTEVAAAEDCMRDAMKHVRTVWLVLTRTTEHPVGAAALIDAAHEYDSSADPKHDRDLWCQTFRIQLHVRAAMHAKLAVAPTAGRAVSS